LDNPVDARSLVYHHFLGLGDGTLMIHYSVKLHLRDGRTYGLSINPSVRPYVGLSLSVVSSGASTPSYGENEPRCFMEI